MEAIFCQPAVSPSLFSAEGFVGIIFLLTVGLVVAGALIAVACKRLVRAIAGLAICFTGLAGVYYFLLSPFLAMMQMLIYVGAVSIIIAFGIMMATPEQDDLPGRKKASLVTGPLGASVGALAFAAFSLLAAKTQWQAFPKETTFDIKEVGMTLLTSHGMVFELISIILLVAIIGALVLAQRGRS